MAGIIAPDLIKITGLRELTRDLKAAGSDLPRTMRTIAKEEAQVVAADAQQRVPVRTGALQATIRAGATQSGAYVRAGRGAQVPYAGPIHFGWRARNIAPQPFLYDAADARIEEVFAAYSARLDALLRSHGL
jgi:HK97 gp10 family phage protein